MPQGMKHKWIVWNTASKKITRRVILKSDTILEKDEIFLSIIQGTLPVYDETKEQINLVGKKIGTEYHYIYTKVAL